MTMTVEEAAARVKEFERDSLTHRLSELEYSLQNLDQSQAIAYCTAQGLDSSLLEASYEIKSLAGQINVIIHAAGLLTALPAILEEGEKIEYLSLGAGNTGRRFDLESNIRIAEFKFIHWKGGPEAIRQNSLFKDFFELAEAETNKQRCLYVLGLTHPLRFFRGRRSIKSVLSKNRATADSFFEKYGDSYSVVSEYYEAKRDVVDIIDVSPMVPQLMGPE